MPQPVANNTNNFWLNSPLSRFGGWVKDQYGNWIQDQQQKLQDLAAFPRVVGDRARAVWNAFTTPPGQTSQPEPTGPSEPRYFTVQWEFPNADGKYPSDIAREAARKEELAKMSWWDRPVIANEDIAKWIPVPGLLEPTGDTKPMFSASPREILHSPALSLMLLGSGASTLEPLITGLAGASRWALMADAAFNAATGAAEIASTAEQREQLSPAEQVLGYGGGVLGVAGGAPLAGPTARAVGQAATKTGKALKELPASETGSAFGGMPQRFDNNPGVQYNGKFYKRQLDGSILEISPDGARRVINTFDEPELFDIVARKLDDISETKILAPVEDPVVRYTTTGMTQEYPGGRLPDQTIEGEYIFRENAPGDPFPIQQGFNRRMLNYAPEGSPTGRADLGFGMGSRQLRYATGTPEESLSDFASRKAAEAAGTGGYVNPREQAIIDRMNRGEITGQQALEEIADLKKAQVTPEGPKVTPGSTIPSPGTRRVKQFYVAKIVDGKVVHDGVPWDLVAGDGERIVTLTRIDPKTGEVDKIRTYSSKLVPAGETTKQVEITQARADQPEVEHKDLPRVFNMLDDEGKEALVTNGRFFSWSELPEETRKAITRNLGKSKDERVPVPPVTVEAMQAKLNKLLAKENASLTDDPAIQAKFNEISDMVSGKTPVPVMFQPDSTIPYTAQEVVNFKIAELNDLIGKVKRAQQEAAKGVTMSPMVRNARKQFEDVEAAYQEYQKLKKSGADKATLNAKLRELNQLAESKPVESEVLPVMSTEELAAEEARAAKLRGQTGTTEGVTVEDLAKGEGQGKIFKKGAGGSKKPTLEDPTGKHYSDWVDVGKPDTPENVRRLAWKERSPKTWETRINKKGNLEIRRTPKATSKEIKEAESTPAPTSAAAGTTTRQVAPGVTVTEGEAPIGIRAEPDVIRAEPDVSDVPPPAPTDAEAAALQGKKIFSGTETKSREAKFSYDEWRPAGKKGSKEAERALAWLKDPKQRYSDGTSAWEKPVWKDGWLFMKRRKSQAMLAYEARKAGTGESPPAAPTEVPGQPTTGLPATAPPVTGAVTKESLITQGFSPIGRADDPLVQAMRTGRYANEFEFYQIGNEVYARRRIFSGTGTAPKQEGTQPPAAAEGGGQGQPPLAGSPPASSASSGGSSSGDAINTLFEKGRESKPFSIRTWIQQMMEKWNDRTWAGRHQQTRLKKLGVKVEPGGELDYITHSTLSQGAVTSTIVRATDLANEIREIAPDISLDDIGGIAVLEHYKSVWKIHPERTLPEGFESIDDFDKNLAIKRARLGDEAYERAYKAAEAIQVAYYDKLERMVEDGRVSRKTANELHEAYPWYNPISYAEDAEVAMKTGKAGVGDVVYSGLRRLSEEGSSKPVRNPFEVIAEDFMRDEITSAQQKMLRALIEGALADPEMASHMKRISGAQVVGYNPVTKEPLFAQTGKKGVNIVSYWKNGERIIYELEGPAQYIYREGVVLNNLVNDGVAAWAAAVNNLSRAAYTSFNPVWMARNLVGDMLTAFLREGILPTSTIAKLITGPIGTDNKLLAKAWALAGGYQERMTPASLTARYYRSGGQIVSNPDTIYRKIKGAIPKVAEYIEQTPRMLVFEKELNKTLPNWRNMTAEAIAATPQARVAAAKSIEATINFARGAFLIKKINPFVLFLNANMEAIKLPIRTLRDNPGSRWRLGGLMAGSVALNVYNMSYKEYLDIPEDIRWGSIIVMLPSKAKKSDGTNKPNYLAIVPKTREWAMFLGPITATMEKLFLDSPTTFGQFSKQLLGNLAPVQDFPLPQAYGEIYAQLTNWDTFRGEPIVPPELINLPLPEQVQPWVSPVVADVATAVNVSPLRFQHAVTGVFGGAATTAFSIADWIRETLGDREDPEARLLKEKYESLTTPTERVRFRTSLTADQVAKLDMALRSPEREFPVLGPIKRAFYPERSGQIYTSAIAAAEEATGLSAKQTAQLATQLRQLTPKLLDEQKKLDEMFNNFQISGAEWRNRRASLADQYIGALKLANIVLPRAAQAQSDPAKTQAYYEIYNQVVNSLAEPTNKEYALAAGWYSIKPEEEYPGELNWTAFNAARQAYFNSLSPENQQILRAYLDARMTPTEKEYEAAQQIMQPYWAIEDQIWAQYGGSEAKRLANYASLLSVVDPRAARQIYRQNRNLLRVQKLVERYHARQRRADPRIAMIYNRWYNSYI